MKNKKLNIPPCPRCKKRGRGNYGMDVSYYECPTCGSYSYRKGSGVVVGSGGRFAHFENPNLIIKEVAPGSLV